MNRKTFLKQGRRAAWAACALLMGAGLTQSCKDEDVILSGQPSWLGNSIYERLQEYGNYTTLLRLIDEVDDNKEVLSHTGSRTLFATNDSAYNEWFKTTTWKKGDGSYVRSYADLSSVQKKVLLNNSMLNNAYLIDLMSNVSGTPISEGRAMRRFTMADIYDSVTVMSVDEMPKTPYWADLRSAGKSIRIFKDNTRAPMIHFLPAYMKRAGFTVDDLTRLTNKPATDLEGAWVDGVQVTEKNITCKNGYIHLVNGVIEASPNMAEIVHQHPEQMSHWASLLDRFAVPYRNYVASTWDGNETQLDKFRRLYQTNDSVYALRYLSKQSDGTNTGMINNYYERGNTRATVRKEELLKFDPGWNSYIYTNKANEDLHYDAGAMIVPTNQAFEEWWNGEGRDLQDEYKVWDSIPVSTVATLLNVNMLDNFNTSLPSMFQNITNDAKVELGIKPENIVESYMGCNGVVYLVNKVFTPAEFSSVLYPATAHPSILGLIYNAIDSYDFKPYLLSMDQTYSLLLPTNKAMKYYMDPVYFNTATPMLISFTYDDDTKTITGSRYNALLGEGGSITIGDRTQMVVPNDVVENRLKNLIDELIVIGDITDGHKYYKTKGGSIVTVNGSGSNMTLQGGWQVNHGAQVPIDDVIQKGNGKTFILDSISVLSAEQSVYQTLKQHDEYSMFLELMNDDGNDLLITAEGPASNRRRVAGDDNKNIRLFSNYNYTVYAPTNAALQKLIDDGLLPTWDDYRAQTAEAWGDNEALADSAQHVLKDIITEFLKYHIQDNSILIGQKPETYPQNEDHLTYESMVRDSETGRFYQLAVKHTDDAIQVKGLSNSNYVNVVKTEGLYNNICREYWFRGTGNSASIYFVSGAVLHQIDGVLLYKEMKPWRQVLQSKVKRN